MIAPFADAGALGDEGALVAAVLLGTAFGWWLERGGLGSARKLAGQFQQTDVTVLKVMFSAILTAALGLFWLARLGALDISRVYVPETYLLPQLLGGALFGIGFAAAGLCPGTSCVAAASGHLDGVAVVVGMFAGVFAFAELDGRIATVHRLAESGARGPLTLPQLLGVSHGVVLLGLVVMALVAFAVAERRERDRAGAGLHAVPEGT